MNTLTWFNYDDTDADSFKIYKSIPGIKFLFSAIVTENPTFRFAATSPDLQEITLDSTNIDTLVTSLGQARGIEVKKSSDNLSVIIRLTAQKNARLKFYQSDLASDLGITTGTIIVPGVSFSVAGTQVYIDQVEPYEFDDVDGHPLDWYYITSVKGLEESLPSFIQAPLLPGAMYCIAEARFVDIQGRPVKGVEVTAEPALLDSANMASNKITIKSDSYGRVSLPLIQCQDYVLHIPAIGYNQFISVPEANFLDITRWAASTKPEYTP